MRFEGLSDAFRHALEQGHWPLALVLVFLAGVGTSLTPCVYPMIAVTVSIFGAQQSASRARAALLSLLFVLGMATLFTPLGLVAALTGGVFGELLAHPAVLVGLALVFVLLALSMFGLFELNLPASWRNRLAQQGGIGPRGAFVLGMVTALIAAPCTGPVLAFLLTWVGSSGNLWLGTSALFVYALGLGLLFGLVGTFAISLPKSGQWMEWVKSAFGIAMLVMAIYYLKDLWPSYRQLRHQLVWLWLALAMSVTGLALGAVHGSYYHPQRSHRWRKSVGIALLALGLGLGMVWWQGERPASLKDGQGHTALQWRSDYQQARRDALEAGRPLLVDFGASWCKSCQELDEQTLSDAKVQRALADFVVVKVDLSAGQVTPEKRQLLASYNQRGLPFIVVHNARGKEIWRLTQFIDAAAFIEKIKALQLL